MILQKTPEISLSYISPYVECDFSINFIIDASTCFSSNYYNFCDAPGWRDDGKFSLLMMPVLIDVDANDALVRRNNPRLFEDFTDAWH